MSKFIVVAFPNEVQAYQGTRALKGLHIEGSLSLYGMAVIAKDSEGNFVVKDSAETGPLNAAVGGLVGAFVGVLGGPIGVLAGAAGGGLVGYLIDIFNHGIGADFIAKVSETMLEPGATAIIAEVGETWTTPLDTRMESLGGVVLRTRRADFEDEQIALEIAQRRADLEQLRAEYRQATAETRTKVKVKLDEARANLAQAEQRLKTRLETLQSEATGKIATLEKQVADAQADAKEKIRQRIAAARADLDMRSAKLKQAWALTQEALAA
jgi:uncharacterized membrane protein